MSEIVQASGQFQAPETPHHPNWNELSALVRRDISGTTASPSLVSPDIGGRLQELAKENAANITTGVGLALVADGARRGLDTPVGLSEVVIGRFADLADGFLARRFNLTSRFGAAWDALADKLGMAIIMHEAWRNKIAPPQALAAIAIQNVANVGATVVAQRRHPTEEFLPTRSGKYSMALNGLALFCYSMSRVLELRKPGGTKAFRRIGHAATTAGLAFGAHAAYKYVQRAARKDPRVQRTDLS